MKVKEYINISSPHSIGGAVESHKADKTPPILPEGDKLILTGRVSSNKTGNDFYVSIDWAIYDDSPQSDGGTFKIKHGSEKIAKDLVNFLKSNPGKSLSEISDMEVPE